MLVRASGYPRVLLVATRGLSNPRRKPLQGATFTDQPPPTLMFTRLLVLALAFVLALPAAAQPTAERPHNVILMIPDGFGPASVTMARMATGAPLALDEFLTGSVGTRSTDHYVTDSAAGATAYSAGIKTYNGAIAMDDDRQPVGTILQGARDRGMRTALVTTTRLTHATPASFAAHVTYRGMEEEIAAQMMDNRVDLLLGGGLGFFRPEPEGRRTDGRDLVAEASAAGYYIVQTTDQLATVRTLPLLGLFASDHLAYEIDRHRTDQPSLAEMTRRALELLDGHPQGFFIMIEGGRIDHAGHANDAPAHLHDILAYDDAVRVALAFARADGRTLVVSAADHETGGLSIGRDGQYGYYPEVLLRTTASGEWMGEEARRRAEAAGDTMTVELLEEIILASSPIEALADRDRQLLANAVESPRGWDPGQTMSRILAPHALIGWTTTGHTGVDVTLHAFGPGSERLRGYMENDEVGRVLADLLQVDLVATTERVRQRLAETATAE
jgi:alkaline phosphatase